MGDFLDQVLAGASEITKRERADHGTAAEAVTWALDHELEIDAGTFLAAWRLGELEEWPDYYVWLDADRARLSAAVERYVAISLDRTHVPELEQAAENQRPKTGEHRDVKLYRYAGSDIYQWFSRPGPSVFEHPFAEPFAMMGAA